MRQALLFTVIVSAAAGCGYGYEARTTTITGAPMSTTAGQPELSRSVEAISERMALEIGAHEARCGRPTSTTDAACIDATLSKARSELFSWNCDPASTRARAEECLASIRTESCEADLTVRDSVCPVSASCGRLNAELTPPGPELAEIFR